MPEPEPDFVSFLLLPLMIELMVIPPVPLMLMMLSVELPRTTSIVLPVPVSLS